MNDNDVILRAPDTALIAAQAAAPPRIAALIAAQAAAQARLAAPTSALRRAMESIAATQTQLAELTAALRRAMEPIAATQTQLADGLRRWKRECAEAELVAGLRLPRRHPRRRGYRIRSVLIARRLGVPARVLGEIAITDFLATIRALVRAAARDALEAARRLARVSAPPEPEASSPELRHHPDDDDGPAPPALLVDSLLLAPFAPPVISGRLI